MAVHGVPRGTQDLDVWIDPLPETTERVRHAMTTFGIPLVDLKITLQDLRRPDTVIQVGFPPNRIDVMTRISGVKDFETAWVA